MGRSEIMGWVALYGGASSIHNIEDKRVKGTPLITKDRGVEGLPDTFIYESVLMVG